MTLTRVHLEIAAVIVALGIAAWAVSQYVGRVKAEVTVQVTEQANKNTLQVIAQHDAEAKANLDAFVKATQVQVDSLKQTVLALKTPKQQVQWSQQQLAEALKGIQITLNPKTGAAEVTIPADSISQLPQVIAECQTCKLDLDVASQKLSYAAQVHADDMQKLAIANQDTVKWKKAAEGGSLWQRFKHDSKLVAIGGAVAITVSCALGHCPK